ncbi:helix-turn-helix domain-containing protein [Thermus sediminis]|jgi:hypothetical protein|uniref:hypothetical protein n=1 Tax=Thermus sediminis TaxID=1761908 RepID=UPI0018E54039|nr:hypothetical protein [Thermus sediminis]
MPQEGVEGKSYKEQPEGLSERGRAFLEALARRKRARGEELPPLYLKLLEGAAPPEEGGHEPPPEEAPPPEDLRRKLREAPPSPALPTREELSASPPPPEWKRDAWDLADRLLAEGERRGTLPGLSERERKVYRTLLALGLEVLARRLGPGRPLPKNLSQVSLFAVNDALSVALGIPPASLYRVLASLEAKGLIRRSAWRTPATLRGRTGVYAGGTLYAVRLPHREARPRLDPEDFRHPWRDLEEDARRGRTAWSLRESYTSPPKEDSGVLELLLGFSLSPGEAEDPLAIDSLTALLRARPAERRALVGALALSLAREFRDPGSVRFYAWVLWNALRAELYGLMEGALEAVAWAVRRAREAAAKALWSPRGEWVRRPGALLAHLLRERGLLELFRQAPQWRVA